MIQIRFNQIGLQFGEHPLLKDISFVVNKGDRIAILGRNGAGKSTLLKLIQGDIEPDSGSIEYTNPLRIATMTQEFSGHQQQTVYEYLQALFESEHEWDTHRIDHVISLLNLPAEAMISALSGGQGRRLSLAAAIINEPDILLLDEPTNHLDIESIEWLEKFLLKQSITLILITHDREFMQKVANRIFEIDLTRLIYFDGSYSDFLKHKEHLLNAEAKEQALFDKKLAQEEAWIRQGIKARRTRNEGRVRALKKMREQHQQRQQRQGAISYDQQRLDYSSKVVIEAINLCKQFNDKRLVSDLNLTLQRGDRIGIIGPNGCGKSTLINLLLERLAPDKGKLKQAAQVVTAIFDQQRAELNLEATAIDNVAEGSLEIEINGKSKHVISYLQDFLFTPEKARSQVKTFSGGEKNRLLLAKILAQQASLLVLDEPTNDLDIESLEFLEDYLLNYPGTLLLVSHDRAFLDNVVTSTLAYEGEGHWQSYVGGYQDFLRQRPTVESKSAVKKPKQAAVQNIKSHKLSYKDQRELELLPDKIEQIEAKLKLMQQEMCKADFYQQDKDIISAKNKELADLEADLDRCYSRWDELS